VKHFIITSVVVLVVGLTMSFSYALTMDDNGYIWNSSDIKEREDFCKPIAARLGRDCQSWVRDLNSVFDSTSLIILNMKLKSVLQMSYTWHRAEGGRIVKQQGN
jgi:hypothetical protein